MRVGHVVPVTPLKCGMYETTREMVWAERKLGIESWLVDPRPSITMLEAMGIKPGDRTPDGDAVMPRSPDWMEDRQTCVMPMPKAVDVCDLIVSHSGITMEIKDHIKGRPWVHVAHGRPYSSFCIERSGGTPVYTMYKKLADDDTLKVVITLWPEFVEYLEFLFGAGAVKYVQAPVDLTAWKPADSNGYDFHGKKADVNVVCCDVWRKDVNPYYVVNAFIKFGESNPNARLHVYAATLDDMKGWGVLLQILQERKQLGEVLPMVYLKPIYDAADVIITPHTIATRIIRESLACGRQVVAGGGKYTSYFHDPTHLSGFAAQIEKAVRDWRDDRDGCIKRNRALAETKFNPIKTARQMLDIYERVLRGESCRN